MSDGGYIFRRILPEETWTLRAGVLWPEKEPGPDCILPGDGLESSRHFGVFHGRHLVSVATFHAEGKEGLPAEVTHRLRAMATHPDHRHRGCGRQVLQGSVSALFESGVSGIWADARKVALGFYAGLGWNVEGPFYEVPKRGLHRLVWTRIGE